MLGSRRGERDSETGGILRLGGFSGTSTSAEASLKPSREAVSARCAGRRSALESNFRQKNVIKQCYRLLGTPCPLVRPSVRPIFYNHGSHGLSARRARRKNSRRPEGPPARSRGLESPYTSYIYNNTPNTEIHLPDVEISLTIVVCGNRTGCRVVIVLGCPFNAVLSLVVDVVVDKNVAQIKVVDCILGEDNHPYMSCGGCL